MWCREWLSFTFYVFLTFESPWYDLRGWLGVKNQLSILCVIDSLNFTELWKPCFMFCWYSCRTLSLMLGSEQLNNDFIRATAWSREESLSPPEKGLKPENGTERKDCSNLWSFLPGYLVFWFYLCFIFVVPLDCLFGYLRERNIFARL